MNKKPSGIINTLKASKGAELLEARRREYEGYGYKDGEIDSEIAADFFGAAVTQKDFERQIKAAELNKSFTQKIIDKVKEVVAELKEIMQKLRGQRLIYDAALDTDAETLDFFVDNLERILNQAGTETKNTATEDGVKYQLKVGAAADVEKALKDKNYRDDVYLTESSPAVIANQNGVRNLPMLMKASHIRENVFTEDEARQRGLKVDKNINYHGLGKDLFLKIIDGLDDVQYAYRGTKNADNPSRRENYFLLISQYKDGDGNTINIPVYINEKGSYNRVFIDTNKIATVYGKENFSDYIQKEVRKGNLVRIKNKSTQASERTTPIVAGYSLNASVDTTITQKSPSVNSILSENSKKITTVTKNTAENSGVKRQNSIENKTAYGTAQTKLTKEYRAAVDRVLNMQDTTADNLVIGYTPELMKDMGMPALPFVIGTGHVYSAAKTEAEAKKDGNYRKGVHYHGLGDTVVKNIYEQLQDPVMIIAAKDVNGNASPLRSTHSVVAIVDVGTANNSLLLPVEITAERTVDGQQMDVNVLSSVYEKKVSGLVSEAIALENSGDVGIYYAKKEADALIPAGVQFPVRIQKAIASNPIVRSFDEKVNRKISDVTQSLQFKRWFGDWQNHPENASKIVNADGTPKVVYHQTDADFTIFNTDNQRAGKLDTDTPTGMFFKPTDQNIGINGTKQMPVYLNARNILELKNRDEAHRYWMQNVPGYAKLQAQYDAVDTKYNKRYEEAENISDEWYDKNYDDLVSGKISDEEALRVMDEPLDKILKEWKSKTEPIAIKQKQLITDFIKNSLYDGIHLSYDGRRNGVDVETFIVFDPTQIKSATDNIGTFDGTNPDIRFQRKLPDVQEKLKKMSGSDDIDDVKRMAYGLADDFMKYAKAARLEMTETRGLMPQPTRISEIVAKYNDYRKTGVSNKQLESDITDI
ncbi:MAG: hypothetical protein SOX69_09755, partial [Oscillospiraceae bacterium]|nr:hypothetical protein [Oscillospiraceae bacterium]